MLARLVLIDRTNAMRAYGRARQLPPALVRAACPIPWVADVTDGKPVYLQGCRDYRNAHGDGSAVEISFMLWPGRIYAVCEPNPPGPADRYRCQAIAGKIVRR
jgi:hypothetical protein